MSELRIGAFLLGIGMALSAMSWVSAWLLLVPALPFPWDAVLLSLAVAAPAAWWGSKGVVR